MATLRLLVIDPDTDGGHCPAIMVEETAGDLLFQGPRVTSESELAEVDGLSPLGPDEIVGRIPARMRAALLRALMEADGADAGADGLR
ncbi:hypothetical protein [Actinomadura sp. WMMB 499]|uniref:hypothetical protein n=1 Tax=Actinomadura sp. WMMB 499 TaxID=1219491 RepID=UPI001246E56A|nr:hypothetical protein [Actinomadura sp. WMMB 499]QFG22794.1 hypothetical protein F7P10_18390 [Actinomadura sp. WMMB 499]